MADGEGDKQYIVMLSDVFKSVAQAISDTADTIKATNKDFRLLAWGGVSLLVTVISLATGIVLWTTGTREDRMNRTHEEMIKQLKAITDKLHITRLQQDVRDKKRLGLEVAERPK